MYFEFKGVKSSDMGVTVTVQPPLLHPETRVWSDFVIGKDGAKHTNLGYRPNEFTAEIVVEGKDNLDKVLGWLKGRGRYTRSDIEGKYTFVHIAEGIELNMINPNIWEGKVTMIQDIPYWYGDDSGITINLPKDTDVIHDTGMLPASHFIVDEEIYDLFKEVSEGKLIEKSEMYPPLMGPLYGGGDSTIEEIWQRGDEPDELAFSRHKFSIIVVRGFVPYLTMKVRNSDGTLVQSEIIDMTKGYSEQHLDIYMYGHESRTIEISTPEEVDADSKVVINNKLLERYYLVETSYIETNGSEPPLPVIKIINPNIGEEDLMLLYGITEITYQFEEDEPYVVYDTETSAFYRDYDPYTDELKGRIWEELRGYSYEGYRRFIEDYELKNNRILAVSDNPVKLILYKKDKFI